MTLDKSLKVAGGSIKSRNVMTRVERIKRLKELERWKEGDPVLGIPKTRVVKISMKKKKKVKGPEEDTKKKKK
jgi:small basic protein (TIGR04137 family)